MKLGFIGCGKMAMALLKGATSSHVIVDSDVTFYDAHAASAESWKKITAGQLANDNAGVAKNSDLILLCVKPGDVAGALREAGKALNGKLLVSIAAGVSLKALQEAASPGARIVRVMPNTPALIGRGASAYATGTKATAADAEEVEKIFKAVGTVTRVPEKLLDAVTGLSGSGPAFVYLMLEALADGGVLMGLPRELALQLATQTVIGSAEMVRQTGLHPAALRDQVTSPGGTTIAGLEALETHGIRAALIAAIRAATERATELGEVK